MMEWITTNWKEVLGTGGIGVIIAALITIKGKSKNNPSNFQKSKSGKHSTTYQAGGSISIKADGSEKVGKDSE